MLEGAIKPYLGGGSSDDFGWATVVFGNGKENGMAFISRSCPKSKGHIRWRERNDCVRNSPAGKCEMHEVR